jgi:SlyX protein
MDEPIDHAQRLERLESLMALQDRTIEKLSDSLFEQQQHLHDLHKQVERLAGKLREMDAALDQQDGLDAPPPHYGR